MKTNLLRKHTICLFRNIFYSQSLSKQTCHSSAKDYQLSHIGITQKVNTVNNLGSKMQHEKSPPQSTQSDKIVILQKDFIEKYKDIVVIGDIHGCNEEFEELLNIVHYNRDPKTCLKILVGDLINKGPLNREVLDNCCVKYRDSIVAVRGNHEKCVLIEREKFDKNLDNKWPTFEWVKDLPKEYIDYIANLPYVIRIPSLKCIIVHAGLNPFLPIEEAIFKTPPEIMVSMRNVLKETKECTKSEKVGEAWAKFWTGPEFIYFGHDARRRLQDMHKFALGLDTGCVYGDRLTGVYIKGDKTGQLISVKAKKVHQPYD